MKDKELLSVTEVSQILRLSRTHVLRKIQSGEIQAQKVGKSFVIRKQDLPGIHKPMNEIDKKSIEAALDKTMADFGDVIKKLGKNE